MKQYSRALTNLAGYGTIDNVFDLLEVGNELGIAIPKEVRDNFLGLFRKDGRPVVKLYRNVEVMPLLEMLYRKARLETC